MPLQKVRTNQWSVKRAVFCEGASPPSPPLISIAIIIIIIAIIIIIILIMMKMIKITMSECHANTIKMPNGACRCKPGFAGDCHDDNHDDDDEDDGNDDDDEDNHDFICQETGFTVEGTQTMMGSQTKL